MARLQLILSIIVMITVFFFLYTILLPPTQRLNLKTTSYDHQYNPLNQREQESLLRKQIKDPNDPSLIITSKIYFDIIQRSSESSSSSSSNRDINLGRIVIGLFGEIAPKTCENFKQLSIGRVCTFV